jgi:hypothetical protein
MPPPQIPLLAPLKSNIQYLVIFFQYNDTQQRAAYSRKKNTVPSRVLDFSLQYILFGCTSECLTLV